MKRLSIFTLLEDACARASVKSCLVRSQSKLKRHAEVRTEVYALAYDEGWTSGEIARYLGRDVSTILKMVRVNRQRRSDWPGTSSLIRERLRHGMEADANPFVPLPWWSRAPDRGVCHVF